MPTDKVSIEARIREAGITMTVEKVDRNPTCDTADPDRWPIDNWKCLLRMGRAYRMTVYYSKSRTYRGTEPTAAEVLNCLANDSAMVENYRSFEDFCSDLGYNSDSRRAKRIWHACNHQAGRLKRFLGVDLYFTLLWGKDK